MEVVDPLNRNSAPRLLHEWMDAQSVLWESLKTVKDHASKTASWHSWKPLSSKWPQVSMTAHLELQERDLKIPRSLQTFYSIEAFLTLFALQAQPYCQICNAQKCGSQEKGPYPLLVYMANRTPQFIEHWQKMVGRRSNRDQIRKVSFWNHNI